LFRLDVLDGFDKEDSIEIVVVVWSRNRRGRRNAAETSATIELLVHEPHTLLRVLNAVDCGVGHHLKEISHSEPGPATVVQNSAAQRVMTQNVSQQRPPHSVAPTVIEGCWQLG